MKRVALLALFGLCTITFALAQSLQSRINTAAHSRLLITAAVIDEVNDVGGQVTSVDANNREFTLRTGADDLLTVTADNATKFDGFDEARLANTFASIAVGQLLEVDIVLTGEGRLRAAEVELAEREKQGELEGVVSSIANTTQFNIVVLGEIKQGREIAIRIQEETKFDIDREHVTIPSGLGFRSWADLIVGQTVRIRPLFPLRGSSINQMFANRVQLKESRLSARVQAINGALIALESLPTSFTRSVPAVTSIAIQTSTRTEYSNSIRTAGLKPGDWISVSGMLFKTTPIPTMVAEKIDKS